MPDPTANDLLVALARHLRDGALDPQEAADLYRLLSGVLSALADDVGPWWQRVALDGAAHALLKLANATELM